MITIQNDSERGRWWIPIGAFLLSAGAMLAAFACFGMSPFGPLSVFTADMDNQYVHFHAALRSMLLAGDGVLFSLHAGLGFNMLPLFAYYLASPFALLTLLFPASELPHALLLITLLKIGMAGAMYAIFAWRVLNARRSSLIFAPLYALCGYVVCYASNIMWLDAVALLPLALCCAHALVTRGRWGGLLATLIAMFATQFYLAYMAGIFTFLCFLVMLWVYKPARPWRTFASFVTAAAAAALCCAVLLLPTALRLLDSAPKGTLSNITWQENFPFFDMFARAFWGSFDTIQARSNDIPGLPPMYSGTLSLLLLIPYFFNARVPWRERAGLGVIFALLAVSFWLIPLTVFWHAFDSAAWFQYRFTFVFCFLWVWIAHRCLTRLDGVPLWSLLCSSALLLVYIMALHPIEFPNTPTYARRLIPWSIAAWTVLLLALRLTATRVADAAITNAVKKAKPIHATFKPRKALLALCAALAITEVGGNAYAALDGIHRENGYTPLAQFNDFFAQRAALLAQLPNDPTDPYRVDSDSAYKNNDGMTLGYNSLQFYSTTGTPLSDTFVRFGVSGLGTIYAHKGSTIALDSLLGIRYLMEPEAPNDYYQAVAEQDGLQAFENPFAFPLAFAAPASVLNYTIPPRPVQETDFGQVIEREDVLALQNELFAALGKDVFMPVPIIATEYEALKSQLLPNGDNQLTYAEGEDGISTVHIKARAQGDGPVYAYWAMRHESGLGTLRRGNEILQTLTITEAPVAAYVGDYWPEDEIALDFELESEGITLVQESLYQLDIGALGELYDAAWGSQMYDLDWKGGELSGTVDVTGERNTLLLTVPYDGGWSATVNGVPVPVERGLSLFCAVPLPNGRNYVHMQYSPPGFSTGLILSASAFGGLLAFLIVRGALGSRRRRLQRPAA